MIKIILVLISIVLLSSCAKPALVDFLELELGSPHYENPKQFEGDGCKKVFAIVEVDQATFNKAKADGEAIFIKEINGQIYYSVQSEIEFDFPEENITNAWCPVLFRYRVKK